MSSKDEKVNQLSMIEHSMQNLIVQKQNLQTQLLEIESALSELEKTDKAYKIVGNIMILTERKELVEDLNARKNKIEIHIKKLEKQEDATKEKAKKLQSEVLMEIEKEK